MRPFFHPNINDVRVETILYALSDPIRVAIFADIAKAECTKICADYRVVQHRSLPKSTLSQHFNILREAGLIYSERKGVEMHNRTRCAELKDRFGSMIGAILAAYDFQEACNKKEMVRDDGIEPPTFSV